MDDEAEIREGLELLLKTEGYKVSMAETGQSGLARLGEEPFDLLLLDVSLPDRNGIEMLKEIRRQDPHLPILFDHRLRLHRDGARGIQKRGDGLQHYELVQR